MLFFNLFLFAKWMNTACKLETTIPNQAKRKVLNLRWYGLALLIGNANLREKLNCSKLDGARGHFP